ncbi:dTDP-4-amino-4,6-dideoxygalactose transaminase [Singulisphaera sp. GP187]|uniref:dTDP-4-amino-4,6-dideoxygalactose transaminase n=1 Tax=Singulisphaera sp. GP187 TaxID=1882752 RepID=UPI0009294A98|nr:dTDP-4-amino-4,6-dideoxygalactose transaminase [Singulisphaera sp. GP187]SIO42863.1 dTDP-4-amino-4,6-dideoxygalactose transaminase [Singulisphaera sp. GP187]
MRTDGTNPTGSPSIPLHRPYLTGAELSYLSQAITSGCIRGDGPFTRRCAGLLEQKFAIGKVLMTPSCTAALELAATLCDLGPGDEVILPSFTFVSTANAIVRLGARPVFVEIRADTLNLDESRIEAALTPRTRAIFPVHYGGIACEMGRIMAIANAHGLRVVEDAAQAVDACYRGRALGSIGHLGTYSFHETKNLVSGEGGALCCNAPELIERAEILRDKGTNRAKFFRGEVDKYTWVDVGASAIPSEIACAFLFAQLEAMDAIKARRRAIDRRYREGLSSLATAGRLRFPTIPEGCDSPFHTVFLMLESGSTRDALMAYLRERGVMATFHFIPLHDSPMGHRLGYREGDLPLTEDLAARLLRLPTFFDLSEAEQSRVIDLVTRFFTQHAPAPKRREPSLASVDW